MAKEKERDMAEALMERPLPTGEGLTFEKVWAMFQEDREQAKITSERFDRAHEKAMKEMEEIRASQRETEQMIKENERLYKRNSKLIGKIGNKFGQLAEHLVAPGIVKRFNELGYHFTLVSKKGGEIHDETGKTLTQIDILLENTELVIAVEVKVRPDFKDIGHHKKRLEIIKNSLLGMNRKVLGAIAGAIFEDTVKKETNNAGFFVIVQSGDTMKIEMPEGWAPVEY
jgi:hypothetical protein